MQSIRNFLLIYLLLTVAITTTVSAVCNYYLDQLDIQEHHDTLMAISAISYQSLLGEDLEKRPLDKIQNSLNNIPKAISKYYPKSLFYSNLPDYYIDRFNFQVWNVNNKLLLHSAGEPLIDKPFKGQGFRDKIINKSRWRVFETYNPVGKFSTVLAEKYDTRFELAHRIALDELYIIFLTFPISGLLIWLVVGKGLQSLRKIAQEIANREINNLDPVNLEKAPLELKPVVDELNMLLERLKESFEREARFAADAAHELKTPLAALKAQAQVALRTTDINDKNTALEKVIASVDRNNHVVQQLLTLSKVTPEQLLGDDWQLINLNNICQDILSSLAQTALDNDVDIELECAPHINKFPGNLTSIGILIHNLIINAINYSARPGHVLVKTYRQINKVVLEVTDNGPGIAEELHDRVFERFYRTLGNNKAGSGLGLSIVQEIANLHNAKIKLSTALQTGGLRVRVFFNIETIKVSDDEQKRNKGKR